MKEKIKKILENNFNIEMMTIEQLTLFYDLYEKVSKKGDAK
jgi:lipid II:glycine glycyltransferase (peptidoglycan interpeptide bridge formation enzyme)